MKKKKSLLDKITLRIKRRKDNVFILRDFDDLVAEYDYDQMLRALRMLVKDGTLVKIGYGIYAKTRTFNNWGCTTKCSHRRFGRRSFTKTWDLNRQIVLLA